jgi:hypothetical protein
MGFTTYVLSVDGNPVGTYSELPRAQREAKERELPYAPIIELQWEADSVDGGDYDRWISGRYAIRAFATNTGDGNPFTGDIIIAINDTPGTFLTVGANVAAEILAHIGSEEFMQLQFLFEVEDRDNDHPGIVVSGPGAILTRVMEYASDNYPRLGAEWCQI